MKNIMLLLQLHLLLYVPSLSPDAKLRLLLQAAQL